MDNQIRVTEYDAYVALCGAGPEVNRLHRMAQEEPIFRIERHPNLKTLPQSGSPPQLIGVIATLPVSLRHFEDTTQGNWQRTSCPLLVLLDEGALPGEDAIQLLRFGVSGFLESGSSAEIVKKALCRTSKGELWAPRALLALTIQQLCLELDQQRFTPREREILHYVATGKNNRDIAERLCITRETVRWHLRAAYTKLGVHDRSAAALLLQAEEH